MSERTVKRLRKATKRIAVAFFKRLPKPLEEKAVRRTWASVPHRRKGEPGTPTVVAERTLRRCLEIASKRDALAKMAGK